MLWEIFNLDIMKWTQWLHLRVHAVIEMIWNKNRRGVEWRAPFKFSGWKSHHIRCWCRNKSPSATNYSFSCGFTLVASCKRVGLIQTFGWNCIPWVFDFEFARMTLSFITKDWHEKESFAISFWLNFHRIVACWTWYMVD